MIFGENSDSQIQNFPVNLRALELPIHYAENSTVSHVNGNGL